MDSGKSLYSFSVAESGSLVRFQTSGRLYVYRNGFEFHRRYDPGEILVNLPLPGKYTANFQPFPVGTCLKFALPELPEKQKDFSQKVRIKIEPKSPDIAKTYAKMGLIVVNQQFTRLNTQYQEFIIQHEIGHQYYFDEEKADTYAFVQYLKKGFNKSQIDYCMNEILSHGALKLSRIENMNNLLSI